MTKGCNGKKKKWFPIFDRVTMHCFYFKRKLELTIISEIKLYKLLKTRIGEKEAETFLQIFE